jgi:hypothetical protein
VKIPHRLPQFEDGAALLLVSGEFEARFYVAHRGEVEERRAIRHVPREETVGKDWGFAKGSSATPSSGAVSAQGERRLNLRKKFQEEVARSVDEMAGYGEVKEIYFFAPSHVAGQILDRLEKHTREKITRTFDGEYVKEGPLEALRKVGLSTV